jgi:rhodanese-related sulfurtransferase
VILICRSGDRSAKAQDRLQAAGFTRVYSIAEGFEGDTAKDGAQAGQRTVNGWKNGGLPWTYKLDKNRMYFPQ